MERLLQPQCGKCELELADCSGSHCTLCVAAAAAAAVGNRCWVLYVVCCVLVLLVYTCAMLTDSQNAHTGRRIIVESERTTVYVGHIH